LPTDLIARWAFLVPGRPTEIWSEPERWISGSETPSASTRLRMMSIARSIASLVTCGCCGVGRPW
jgi:hypothetical protein